jgi:surface protein
MISSGGNANSPVLEVMQWGEIAWTSMAQMLQNNYNILITATDSPDLSNCVSMNSMFYNCQNTAICTNGSMNNWDVSNINNMAAMFGAATAMNADISNWDVSSVLSFGGMFAYAYAFNSNISNWDVSSGQAFNQMLSHAYAFTVDVGNWNVSSATNMREMFFRAGTNSNTTQNLSVKVVNSGQANQYLAWYTPLCQNFQSMFRDCLYGRTNTDFQNWNVSSATTMKQMFDGYSGFNATTDMTPKSVTMGGVTWNAWDTSGVTTFLQFAQNSNLSQDISGWDVSAATNLQLMTAATGVDYIFDWTALNSSLTTMNYIFGGSSMSTNNYTDSIVHFANLVKNQNPNAPLSVDMGMQLYRTFDTTRSGGSNFANAGRARSFLTLDISVSGLSGYNGTYYYDYATGQYINESDNTLKFVYNTGESVWELHNEEGAQYAGTGGSQANGPTSATWSGFTVSDASKGWSITSDLII